MLPTDIQVNWSFGSGEETKKNENQDGDIGGQLGLPIGTILSYF